MAMIKLVKAMCAACVVATMVAYAQDAEVVKVKGRGVGVNKIEALKDAYRDAVEPSSPCGRYSCSVKLPLKSWAYL